MRCRLHITALLPLTLLACGDPDPVTLASRPAVTVASMAVPEGGIAKGNVAEASAGELARDPYLDLVDAHDIRDLERHAGALWAGTAGGLLTFRKDRLAGRMTVADGLLSNQVTALHSDGDGRLWIAYERAGCQVLSAEGLTGCPSGLEGLEIADFAESRGVLYAAARSGALLRLDLPADASLPDAVVEELGVVHPLTHQMMACDDRLWLASRGWGLGILAFGNETAPSEAQWRVERERRVIEALTCHDGTPYAGGPDGLFRYTGSAAERAPLHSARQHVRLLTSAEGALVVGLSDGQVRVVEGETVLALDLPLVGVTGVFAEGRFWFGGERGLVGVQVSDRGALTSMQLPGPGANDISAIAAAGEVLALGMFRQGIAILREGRWRTVKHALPSPEVNALAFDSQGRLWVATSRGLARVDADGSVGLVLREPLLPCDHINSVEVIEVLGEEGVAVATSCGVGLVRPEDGAVVLWEGRENGLPHRIVYDLALWRGRLVAATNDGLAIRDGEDPERPWTVFRAGWIPLADNWITAVSVTADDELVVGTYSDGLYVGSDPSSLSRVEGPLYVNLGALLTAPEVLLVGGLSEGAYAVRGDRGRRIDVGRCLQGDDVTGFAVWRGTVIAATRSGAAPLSPECWNFDMAL